MNEGATRQTMAPGSAAGRPSYNMSLTTSSPVVTKLKARVVGMPRWCMASLQTNSRSDERNTARPSARREYGVGPAPLSWSSSRLPDDVTTSPSDMARPSPSCPAQLPNW